MNILINKFQNYIFLLLFLTLPFSNSITNILLIIFFVLTCLNIYISKSKIDFIPPIYIYIVFFFYSIINFAIQSPFEDNSKFWRFIPILLLGFLSITQPHHIDFKKVQKTSIISCLIFILYISIKTLIFYYNNSFLPFGNGEQVNDILIIDRPYLGFYILLNIILSFDLFLKEKKKKYLFIVLFFSFFLLLILARLSILSLIIISFIYLIFYAKINYKLKLSSLILILFSLGFILKINPNTKERFNTESYEKFVDYEPRFVIWKSAYNISNNNNFNKLTGFGNKELIDNLLVEQYIKEIDSDSKRSYFVDSRFNSHSQFFDFYLMGGIPLLSLFIIFLISLIIYFRKDYLSMLILICFILFFFVENVFARQFGCLLFSLYIGFCIIQNKLISQPSNKLKK